MPEVNYTDSVERISDMHQSTHIPLNYSAGTFPVSPRVKFQEKRHGVSDV